MNIYVNEKKISIFHGATVKSALMKYYRATGEKVNLDSLDVRDAYGNSIALDGSLSESSRIFTK